MAFPAENQKFAVHFNVLAITPSLHRHLDRASRPMPAFGAVTALDPQPATPPGFNNCSVHTHPTPHCTRLNHHKPHSSGSLQIPLAQLAPNPTRPTSSNCDLHLRRMSGGLPRSSSNCDLHLRRMSGGLPALRQRPPPPCNPRAPAPSSVNDLHRLLETKLSARYLPGQP